MTRILSIGLGGVGTIAAYTLDRNEDVELTAVIRSDYEVVSSKGYDIRFKSSDESVKNINFKPDNIVKTLEDAGAKGPFDYIVVSTKCIPQEHNIWDHVYELKHQLIHDNSSIVLIQNGIGIEKYWSKIPATLISGVSYISSTNTNGSVHMFAPDEVSFGLFDKTADNAKLDKFIELFSNGDNTVTKDEDALFTRFRKLLYNASFNTVCCLTNSDVGVIYDLNTNNEIALPIMKEIQIIANQDLKLNGLEKTIDDIHISNMIKFTGDIDAPNNYAPSMLVDFRSKRQIELEVILGNLIEIYNKNNSDIDIKLQIPYLNFLYHSLKIVQFKLKQGLI